MVNCFLAKCRVIKWTFFMFLGKFLPVRVFFCRNQEAMIITASSILGSIRVFLFLWGWFLCSRHYGTLDYGLFYLDVQFITCWHYKVLLWCSFMSLQHHSGHKNSLCYKWHNSDGKTSFSGNNDCTFCIFQT